jgi:mannose/fructose/N-acetylgalactosamine-specific phosphotransferase system component IIC
MDPRQLFPWLALGFAVAAALRLIQSRRLDGMARTWAILAVMFALVSAWLRFAA